MDHPLLMSCLQTLRHLQRDLEGILDRDRSLANSFRQCRAFDELKNQRLGLACFFDPVNLPDVGMIQGGQDLRFSLKPGHSLGIRGKLLG